MYETPKALLVGQTCTVAASVVRIVLCSAMAKYKVANKEPKYAEVKGRRSL